ncbi:MAG TPA: hypothetical protein PLC98_19070 [Anaerolineales bacterium]|nr:hypothetical protein [Anaerolineales bacterium]
MTFTQELLHKAHPYIDAQVQKPFLQGLINGDLPEASFAFWLKVDYPYLYNFIKVMSVGLAKSSDPQDMWVFLEHIKGIQKEMLDHEGHAARIGVSREELLTHRPSPLKYTYMTHQLVTAHQGGPAETQAAVLACQWGYGECARTLLRARPLTPDNRYAPWFAFHASEEHLPGLQSSLDLLDRHAAHSTPEQRARWEAIFFTSVELETMLWDEYFERRWWETYPKAELPGG